MGELGVWMASSAHARSTALRLAFALQISVHLLPLQLPALQTSARHGLMAPAQNPRHAVAQRPMVATRALHPLAQVMEFGVWMASSARARSTALQLAIALQISVHLLPPQLPALQMSARHGLMAPAQNPRHAVAQRPMVATRALHPLAQVMELGAW